MYVYVLQGRSFPVRYRVMYTEASSARLHKEKDEHGLKWQLFLSARNLVLMYMVALSLEPYYGTNSSGLQNNDLGEEIRSLS